MMTVITLGLTTKDGKEDGAVLWHESQIDLSGYAMDSLTFFPSAVGLQDPWSLRI